MIKNYFLAFLVFCCACSFGFGQVTDLIISEYVEGSGNNKYIELFNGTGASINLSDYELRLFTNGSSTPSGNSTILSGTLANNSTIVYRNSSATIYLGASTNINAIGFNGNDAIALYKISTTSYIDIFGVIGDDPGSAWTAPGYLTANRTLVRKSTVCGGITINPSGTGAGAFTTLSTEWDIFPQDAVSNLGGHSVSCVVGPEIEVQGNGIEIFDGASSPNIGDDTDFGATAVTGGTITRTFTILNTGGADLSVSNVTSNNAEFTVSGTTTGIINPSNSINFVVTFDPSIIGTRAAIITINSDDSDENPYTFIIEGIGTNSNASDIIASPGFTYTNNIPYLTYQAAGPFTNTTGNIGVFRFDLRDGGTTNDTDALGTELNSISFNVGTTHINYIRAAGLFDVNAVRAANPIIDTGAGTITFSGLSGANFTALDDGVLTLTLRVSFTTNVTDNEKLIFTVSNATANPSNSVFATTDAGAAFSDNSIGNNRNRLEVLADRLSFNQQPSDTNVNTTMAPSVEVVGNDINNNLDLDWTGMVALTSTGTMTGGTLNSIASGGIASFNSIVHAALSPPSYVLNTTSAGLNSATSNPFEITSLPLSNGDYRTTGSGNWTNNSIWERYNAGTWAASNAPAANTVNRLYIRNSHTINTNESFGSAVRLYILGGGYFINEHNSTAAEVYIYDGGILDIREFFRVASAGTLEVFDGGTIYFDDAGNANLSTSLWNGVENFHPQSELYIYDIDPDEYLYDGDVTTNTYNGYTAAFGNVYVDYANSITGSIPADNWENIFGENGSGNNFCHNNLEFLSSRGNANFKFAKNDNITTGIGGDLIVQSGIGSSRSVFLATGIANLNLTIIGNLELDCAGDLAIRASNSPGRSVTLNIQGNILMNGPNTQSSTGLKMNLNIYTTPNNGVSTINLEGDLLVGDAILENFAPRDDVRFNFTGSMVQIINIESIVGNSSFEKGVPFYIKTGAEVQLSENDLNLNFNSFIEVEDGGTLDFGFDTDGITPLLVKQPNSPSGSNEFRLDQGGTLKITSPDGITSIANLGNVQVTPSNRVYNQTANFYYTGKQNQVTGNALTVGSTVKNVFVNLDSNNLELRLTNRTGISDGGKLEIQQGIVIGEEIGANDNDFYGPDGQLIMTGGEYRISTITTNQLTDYLPQLRKYSSYILTGGIIHLNGVGFNNTQILSGVPDYVNLSFSGDNILAALPPLPPGLPTYKGISIAASVSGTITISQDAIVDIQNKTLGGSGTDLIMEDNARFIMAGSSNTKPDATGSYSLSTTSTIEFNNNNSGLQEIRLTNPIPSYANIVVSGSNVGTVALGTGPNSFLQFQSNGSFTITGTGTFKQSNSSGFSGLANTSISSVNNPTIALLDNSTVEYAGANQIITPFGPEYKNVTLSGSGIKSLGHPTNILVGEDLNIVSATLNINTGEAITVDEGVIVTGGTMNIEDSGSLIQINDTDTNSGNISMKRSVNIRQQDYVYWASPVNNFNVNNVSPGTSTNYIYRWDNTAPNAVVGGQGNWVSASGETMTAGVGYIVRGSDAFDNISLSNLDAIFNTGSAYNGEINVTASRGSLPGDDDAWNLVGNPYPSAINAIDFLTLNSNIEGFINLWTHGSLPSAIPDPFYETNGGFNYNENDYITYNITGTSSGPGVFNGTIAAAQSFMINLGNGPDNSSEIITFRNSLRSNLHDNSQFYRAADLSFNDTNTIEKHRIWLDLALEDSTAAERLLLGYISDATIDEDRLYDAPWIGSESEQGFYSLIDSNPFIIQGRALPFIDTDKVELGLKITTSGTYTIAIHAIDGLFDNQNIYLKDHLINFIHDLSNSPYTFTSNLGEFNNRFEIVFKADALSINDTQIDANQLTITELDDGAVQFKIEKNLIITAVEILDVTGRQIYKLKGNASTEIYNLSQLSKAPYVAKVTLSNGQVISKKAIKQH